MRRIIGLMLRVAGPYRDRFATSIRDSVIGSLAQAGAYACVLPILYELSRPQVDAAAAWRWFAVFAACYAVEAVFRCREIGFQYTEWARVIESIRLRLGDRLRRMPLRELERRATGDLTTVVGGNTVNAALGVSAVALVFLQMVTVPVVLIAVFLVVDWRLGLTLAVVTPLAVPFVRRVQRILGSGFRRVDQADAAAASRIVEYVQGLPVFKATGQVGESSVRLQRALREQTRHQAESQTRAALPALYAAAVVQLGVVAVAAVGTALVLGADLTVPVLVAVVAGAVRFAEPLATATTLTAMFEITDAAVERVVEVLDTQPLDADPDARITRFDVAFDEVEFAYAQGGTPVLRGVTFAVPARSFTALVGPSGSGKTTVTKLLTRYADPDAGTVRIGGVDLRTVDPGEIYRHVSVVFQDVYLFDDTIRANIAMARPDATDAEVEAAARAANVHGFVERLPHGYETRVGEIGGSLSGGERQRISIARAVLKDAPIVLLDEPTAALDAESEVAVQQAIDALVADRTVVVIAHRMSTVVGADQILVLADGRIAERGRHAELLAAGGRYARMWEAQTRARHWRVGAETARVGTDG
jgi:ATP-binding cassette, subfamily B, bacterial IrtB/YbtQ